MRRITFQTSLLFAPLAFAFHHLEEHVLGKFRAWRLKYFLDNNHIPTEAVVCILMATTLTALIVHAVVQSKRSAQCALLLLMATQVHNMLFHVGGTLVFWDWSPGTVTAVVLYIPVNLLIAQRALEERWITRRSWMALFILGGLIFWSWELLGPVVLVVALVAGWAWVAQGVLADRRANSAQSP